MENNVDYLLNHQVKHQIQQLLLKISQYRQIHDESQQSQKRKELFNEIITMIHYLQLYEYDSNFQQDEIFNQLEELKLCNQIQDIQTVEDIQNEQNETTN